MKSRNLTGPFFLITIGVLWLLAITRTISVENMWALAHLVPFVLIAIGVSLLIRTVWPVGGIIFSILIVVGIILAVVFAPQLGWNDPPSWVMNLDVGENVGGAIKGSGVVVSETRPVEGIDALEVNYPSDVFIQQGEVESLTLEAEDNLLPQLSAQVVNGRLVVYNTVADWEERVNPSEKVQVRITVKDLSSIQFSSAGNLHIDGLEADDLDIQISGICNVTLEDLVADRLNYQVSGFGNTTADGVVESLGLQMSGFGDFDGEDLSTQRADVHMSGFGTATVWVTDELDASISGAGSLNYYGNPTVDQEISGVASVNHKGDK